MEFTFLGTSSGAPTSSRNVTGLARSTGSRWDLFDCGEATQHQILRTPLALPRLRRVFISHLHGDHCFGLFGLLGSRAMANTTRPLTVYGPAGLDEMLAVVLRVSSTHLSFPMEVIEVPTAGGVVVESETETITAVPLDHRVPSFGWHLVEAPRVGRFDPEAAARSGVPAGPLYARLQRGEPVELDDGTRVDPADVVGPERPGRRVFVAGDNADPARVIAHTGRLDLLVHEATFTETVLERMDHDYGHSTAARVAAACEGVVENLVLTHFSPRFGPTGSSATWTVDDVRTEAESRFTGTLMLASDFDRFELSADGSTLARR